MTTPRIRDTRPKKAISLPLTNAVAVDHNYIACVDTTTGKLTNGGTSTTLLPIGYFRDAATGDGTTVVTVDLFDNVVCHFFDNDTGSPVAADDIGSTCYIKDTGTVSMDSTGRSIAGIVFQVDSILGVGVLFNLGARGATGATVGAASVADRTALAALSAANRFDGMLCLVRSDNALFRFDSAASFTSDTYGMIGVTPGAGTGRWVRADKSFIAKLPIAYTTADAAALLTVPTGFALRLTGMPFWDVVTGFSGGASSAIGLSATAIATAKGDLLGGAAGELAATLVAGVIPGTIGPKIDTLVELQAMVLKAADALRFDRITSVYTAGAGFVCVPVALHQVG